MSGMPNVAKMSSITGIIVFADVDFTILAIGKREYSSMVTSR